MESSTSPPHTTTTSSSSALPGIYPFFSSWASPDTSPKTSTAPDPAGPYFRYQIQELDRLKDEITDPAVLSYVDIKVQLEVAKVMAFVQTHIDSLHKKIAELQSQLDRKELDSKSFGLDPKRDLKLEKLAPLSSATVEKDKDKFLPKLALASKSALRGAVTPHFATPTELASGDGKPIPAFSRSGTYPELMSTSSRSSSSGFTDDKMLARSSISRDFPSRAAPGFPRAPIERSPRTDRFEAPDRVYSSSDRVERPSVPPSAVYSYEDDHLTYSTRSSGSAPRISLDRESIYRRDPSPESLRTNTSTSSSGLRKEWCKAMTALPEPDTSNPIASLQNFAKHYLQMDIEWKHKDLREQDLHEVSVICGSFLLGKAADRRKTKAKETAARKSLEQLHLDECALLLELFRAKE